MLVSSIEWTYHISYMMSGTCSMLSELRPPTGLLFIFQVIHERGETWWNIIGRGKLIRPPELSGSPTS
jgi:hypothetical protein